MPLVSLKFAPGVIRDATAYTAKGAWVDSNLIRFRFGMPESMGGWQQYGTVETSGLPRALYAWYTLEIDRLIAIGTNRKYYVEFSDALYDITPVVRTVTLAADSFAVSTGSNILTVTDASFNATLGAFVTFSGATGVGNITASELNREHEITEVIDADTYEVTLSLASDTTSAAFGGASIVAAYQISPGTNTQTGGTGWGAGVWGAEGWGEASEFNVEATLRLWTQSNYGEDLIFNVRNGNLFYWDNSLGLATRAVTLAARAGADSSTPTIAMQVMVSDQDRHILAFGTNWGGTTEQDPMIIRFSDQENPLIWNNTALNTAGELRLGSGSRIVRAMETKREVLVWTDTTLYSMQFLGPPFTFGIQQVSTNVSAMGFNCFATAEDATFWMGRGIFYMYTGQVQELPCSVKEYVFTDMNLSYGDKVFAGTITEFGEVIWFYPSKDSEENDRYVIFNYRDKAWYFGQIGRSAWLDNHPEGLPLAATSDGKLYYHEVGFNDGSVDPPAALNAYIESAPIDITEGNRFMFIRRVLPDVTFFDATPSVDMLGEPLVTMTLTAQDFPGADLGKVQDTPTRRSAMVPVEQFTKQKHIRLRGRSVRIRVESDQTNTRWTLGTPRIDVQPDGGRA